ncbi:bidirectional sugar transporter sweet14 [Phtheirospermum japonicum]|uniref:Bidirectional sugar transporter SWEET n=1 Tax=Phtheirospermum japonicum TaxID=374723 RepID=A0A830C2E4_9LAMI|nr:bidirectional sugar transporter sweet14 [Phtheirospermum japonicum]
MVFLAPISTFYQIYKKKSSEGFQSIPYVVALFSAVLWIYYALLKSNTTLLITINSVGCVIETIYIVFYIYYASKAGRVQTLKLLGLLMSCGAGLIGVTHFLVKSPEQRAIIVGWICLIFSLCVFVAPLCILRQVIRTKSVEHMPFLLSFFLTLSAVMWFFYGLLLKDFNIAIPNVLGFTFGILQMVLYLMYKNARKTEDQKLPQIQKQIMVLEEHKNVEIVKISALDLGSDKIPVVAQVVCRNEVEAISLPQKLPKECEV